VRDPQSHTENHATQGVHERNLSWGDKRGTEGTETYNEALKAASTEVPNAPTEGNGEGVSSSPANCMGVLGNVVTNLMLSGGLRRPLVAKIFKFFSIRFSAEKSDFLTFSGTTVHRLLFAARSYVNATDMPVKSQSHKHIDNILKYRCKWFKI